jgi:UPF0716 protein FxsA
MTFLLLVLLFALPVAELAVLVQVSRAIGILDAIALLLVTSLIGVWLTRRAGRGALTRIRRTQEAGKLPSREMTDGAIGLGAGVLLVLPGFITDGLGLALFLPPVRAGVRTLVLRRLRRSGRVVVWHDPSRDDGQRHEGDDVWDVESWEEPAEPGTTHPRPQSWHQGEIGGPR